MKDWWMCARIPHLKVPIYFKHKLVWCHFEQNEATMSSSSFGVCFREFETCWTFRKRLLQLVNTFKLRLVHGDYVIGICALGLHLLWCGNLLWGISSVQSGFATSYACYRNATRMSIPKWKWKECFNQKFEVWRERSDMSCLVPLNPPCWADYKFWNQVKVYIHISESAFSLAFNKGLEAEVEG